MQTSSTSSRTRTARPFRFCLSIACSVLIGALLAWTVQTSAQTGVTTGGGGRLTSIPAGVGIAIASGAPSVTTDKLYQVGNNLYWNGAVVQGSGASAWARTGTVLTPTTAGDIARIGIQDKGGQVFNVTAYGAKGDGTTDDSAAVTAAIAAAAVNGGTVFFPTGTYRIDSQIVLPNDSGTIPKQKAMRWLGTGAFFSGQGGTPTGGTILDLRYVGSAEAKIKTHGLGYFEIDGMTITSTVASTNPFLLTTNTTIHPHDTAWVGNASKNGSTSDQDAIILGGTTETVDGSDDSPFQGYGTVIERNYFHKIRRGVYFRHWANGVVVRDNTWWNSCGASGTTAGAIELDGGGAYDTGNIFSGNLIEAGGYKYPVKVEYAEMSYFANTFWDEGSYVTAEYYFDTHGVYNQIVDIARSDTIPLTAGAGAATNSVITAHQDQPSVFAQPVTFTNTPSFNGRTVFGLDIEFQPILKPAVDSSILFWIKRSLAESDNPGTYITRIANDGSLFLGGNGAGTVTFADQAGTTIGGFSAGGRTWSAAGSGGDMTINSGTGGSYISLLAYAFKLKDHTGANEVQLKNGAGSPEGAFAAPVGSLYMRTNGSAGATLYVKESGASNTGWTPLGGGSASFPLTVTSGGLIQTDTTAGHEFSLAAYDTSGTPQYRKVLTMLAANGMPSITVPANVGLTIADGAPTDTTNKLYQAGGVLTWNGTAVGTPGYLTTNNLLLVPGANTDDVVLGYLKFKYTAGYSGNARIESRSDAGGWYLGNDIRLLTGNGTDVSSSEPTLRFLVKGVNGDALANLYSDSGGYWQLGSTTEQVTLSTTGATTDTTGNVLPANAIIEAVTARVTTTITTATDWALGDATIATRFCSANATLTAGTTSVCFNQVEGTGTSGKLQTSAAKLRITTSGTPGAGVIRVTVYYRKFVAPTS